MSEDGFRHKKSLKDRKKKRRRRYSSASSYSSSESDSDSDSEKYSYSSLSSSSSSSYSSPDSSPSDERPRRKKHRQRHGRKKRDARRDKRRSRRDKKSRRKSKKSSESTRYSTSSNSNNSDDEVAGPRGSVRKTANSIDAEKKLSRDLGKQHRPLVSGKVADIAQKGKGDLKSAKDGPSHEEGECSQDKLALNNGNGTELKSDKTGNQHPNSDDDTYKDRRLSSSPKRSQSRSPRSSSGASPKRHPRKSPQVQTINDSRQVSRQNNRNYSRSPPHKDHEPPVSNHRRSLSRSKSPDGNPKRIRRGRGFTDRYSFTRKYRTPSPERSPPRSRYGGQNIQGRNRERYSSYRGYAERSPLRRYRSPPRGRSPFRYQRRSRSRSISRSPPYRHRNRERSQSPVRGQSPVGKLPAISEKLRSRLGPREEGHPISKSKLRSRSRSRSLSHSTSSGDVAPRKRADKGNSRSSNRSRSSSPAVNRGLVSYGDISPEK